MSLLMCLCAIYLQAQSEGPVVWLKADHKIEDARWPDASISKNDAIAFGTSAMPAADGFINFNPTMRFDGVDDYLKIPFNLESLSGFTVFAVFHCNDTTERGVWGIENAATRNILLTTRRAAGPGPDSISELSGKAERIAVINSVIQSWDGVSTTPSSSYIALGSAGSARGFKPFQGSFAEFMLFDHALTFLQRTQYETYLAIKYGTSLTAGNYVSSKEKVLWNTEKNHRYRRNIFGIGRDDHYNLYQKQSGSAYDSGLMVISTGPLERFNHENLSLIDDGNFILFGDNGLPLTLKRGTGADSVLAFTQRKWLASITGNTDKMVATELRIDISKFHGDPMAYQLVIDRSGQGNFAIDNLEFVSPVKVENGKLVFENLQWDTDHSGKDIFGFARVKDFFVVVRKLNYPDCANPASGQVRIDIVRGTAPYTLELSNAATGSSRKWKQEERSTDQKDLEAGNYALRMTDAEHEAITTNFSLAIPGGLLIDLGDDRKLSPEAEVVLDISSLIPDTVEVSYRWTNNSGFSSNEEKITVSESGIYRVHVTREKDKCIFSDEVVISGTESQRITVFPNVLRSHEQYNVNVSLPEPGPVLIKVFDSRGTLTQRMEGSNSPEYQFTGAVKDSGLYLVMIQTPGGLETKKVIVH